MFLYNLLWNSDVKCEQNVDIKPKVYQGRQWRSTGSQVCALWTRTADLLIFWGPISPPWKAHAHVGSIPPGKQSADKKMQGGKTPTSASLLWRNMSHPRVVPAPSVLPIRLYRGHDIPRTSAKSVCGMAKKKKKQYFNDDGQILRLLPFTDVLSQIELFWAPSWMLDEALCKW